MKERGATPTLVGRLAGLVALGLLVDFIAFLFIDPHNTLHANPTSQYAIGWAATNGGVVKLEGFSDGLLNTLFAILVILLVALTGARGTLVGVIYVMVGGTVALQWAHAGMLYALAALAHRGGADAGVLALFTLGYTMDDSDSIPIAVTLVCLGVLMLRSGAFPAPLAWLTLVVAAPQFVSTLANIEGVGILDVISVLLSLVWALVLGVTLLIKPVWPPREPGGASAPPAGG